MKTLTINSLSPQLIALLCPMLACAQLSSPIRDMPDHDQSELGEPKSGYYCGPVAAWNSMEWLWKTYPAMFKGASPADWKKEVMTLGGYMKTDVNEGTWASDFIEGKKTYLGNNAKPGTWTIESLNGDWDPVTKSWNTEVPTWKWIKEQMDKGQDVEVIMRWGLKGAHWDLGGEVSRPGDPAKGFFFDENPYSAHIVTLDHYVWDDDGNGVLDSADSLSWFLSDPHQDAFSLTGIGLGASPVPAHKGKPSWIQGVYDGKEVFITAAVAESPIPEPEAIGVLAILFVLAFSAVRRRG